MSNLPITVVLAGVGDLGRFVVEVLQADDRLRVVVLSRSRRQWFTDRGIEVELTDYSTSSVLPILNKTKASALISLVYALDQEYVHVHTALLTACRESETCKRFIPSEWGGNVDDFPHLPRFYNSTRGVLREMLAKSTGVEWTLMNLGFFMDYFVPTKKTYIKPQPGWWPIDLDKWEVVIRGTGDEPQSWTSARDVAAAVPDLLLSPKWVSVCPSFGAAEEAQIMPQGKMLKFKSRNGQPTSSANGVPSTRPLKR